MVQLKNNKGEVLFEDEKAKTVKDLVKKLLPNTGSFKDCDFFGQDLSGLNFAHKDLRGANLSGANLTKCDLVLTKLDGALLEGAKMPDKLVNLPEDGAVVGFKKLMGGILVKVEVPADAQRVVSWGTRLCRASALKVLAVVTAKGASCAWGTGDMPSKLVSWFDNSLEYKVGELVAPNSYNGDNTLVMTNGLHFCLTEKDARES